MGFLRQGQPAALDRRAVRNIVTPIVKEEIAFLARTSDPFGIDHDCINPTGHDFIGSCGDVACVHCARVAP